MAESFGFVLHENDPINYKNYFSKCASLFLQQLLLLFNITKTM